MKKLNLLIYLVVVAAGCVRTYDITADHRYYVAYKLNQVYATKTELVLRQFGSNYLAVPGKSAPDIKAIQENPGKWNDILGIIPPNTKIKIIKLEQKKSIEYNVVFVYAEIMNGPFANQVVELTSVSNFDYEKSPDKAAVPIPDLNFIYPVD